MTTQQITVTLFGETHEVEVYAFDSRLSSVESVVVGRFPTGTKLHKSQLTLWKRVTEYEVNGETKTRTLRGETAAVVDGEEFIADSTLYLHNSNRGRIVAWNSDVFPASVIGRWS